MKILITGASGYLGQGLIVPFEGKHELRLMDVRGFDSPHERVIGDVADLNAARQAVEGVEAIVIAHMASRQAGAYETPPLAFDANVKGTANLFFAAAEQGVRRICLISTTDVAAHGAKDAFWSCDSVPRGGDLYALTKACQEVIAEQYHRVHHLAVSVLRIGWVMDADTMIDKYGQHRPHYAIGYTDRRDIGEAARLALECPDMGYEVFYVEGTPESAARCDMAHIRDRLGWKPAYDFKWLPVLDAESK